MTKSPKVWCLVAVLILASASLVWAGNNKRHSSGGGSSGHSVSSNRGGGRPMQSRNAAPHNVAPQRNDIYDYRHATHQSPAVRHTQVTDTQRTLQDGSHFNRTHDHTEIVRPNGTRTVVRNNSIVHERTFVRDRHTYVQRTFIQGGNTHVRDYVVTYRGRHPYYGYVPHYIYPRPFYAWSVRPWRPVYYRWGWAAQPWYPYYGYYWQPYPIYYGPAFWITDFVLADILAASYAANATTVANTQSASSAPIDSKIKAQVQKEVQAELYAREKQQSVPIDRTLKENYLHVITSDLNVTKEGSSDTCALTSGDIVKVAQAPKSQDPVVKMTVVTSKKGNCAANAHVLMSVDDVQDMNNHFSESIDKGVEQLHAEQGKDGIPTAPEAGQAMPQDSVTPQEKTQAAQDAEAAAKEMHQ